MDNTISLVGILGEYKGGNELTLALIALWFVVVGTTGAALVSFSCCDGLQPQTRSQNKPFLKCPGVRVGLFVFLTAMRKVAETLSFEITVT